MNGTQTGLAEMRLDGTRIGLWMSRKTLSLDLVSAYAGDRTLTEDEKRRLEAVRAARGAEFYSDLLYVLSHESFPPGASESLWHEILRHKMEMSRILHRNVRIAVAALDYLFNLKGQLSSPTLMDERQADVMALMAVRDGLTRLYNHAACLQKIETELNLYHRYGTVFSLVMIDVDNFKTVNDRYGHREGDRLLAVLADLIVSACRETDIACRYGGEEFAVILPLTGPEEASALAERLRLLPILRLAPERVLTLSLGVAFCGPEALTVQALVDKADEALYQAKREGRNRVVTAA